MRVRVRVRVRVRARVRVGVRVWVRVRVRVRVRTCRSSASCRDESDLACCVSRERERPPKLRSSSRS